jgi:hypothetical protein
MSLAFHIFTVSMGNKYQNRRVSSRIFSELRKDVSKHLSDLKTGTKQTIEVIQNRANKNRGKTRPKEAVIITAEKNRGQKRTEETRNNIS